MKAALASGLLLGISCGLMPGPLMALVLSQTLRHGPREGCKVAMVPLFTDLPVIMLAMVVASKASQFHTALGILSLVGGAFVLYLAADHFRPVRLDFETSGASPKSLLKGVAANLLSPNPWLFWLTIGATTLAKAMADSWLAATLFLVIFYVLLVGSKVILALLAGRSRGVLTGRPFRWVMGSLGVMLAVFAIFLFRQGFEHLHK